MYRIEGWLFQNTIAGKQANRGKGWTNGEFHESIESGFGPMHAIPPDTFMQQAALAELQPRLDELRRIEQVGGWYYDPVSAG